MVVNISSRKVVGVFDRRSGGRMTATDALDRSTTPRSPDRRARRTIKPAPASPQPDRHGRDDAGLHPGRHPARSSWRQRRGPGPLGRDPPSSSPATSPTTRPADLRRLRQAQTTGRDATPRPSSRPARPAWARRWSARSSPRSARALFAIPLGILAAIYLNEYGKQTRLARFIRFMTDVMTGVPSIVMGIFIYRLWIVKFGDNGSRPWPRPWPWRA